MNQQSRPPKWSEPGYSKEELDHAQEKWALEFPPDLVEFFLRRRPYCTGDGFFDWTSSLESEIHQLLAWPFNGFWFDVQHNGVWWPDWGSKPDSPALQMARLKEVFRDVPRLIPIYGRRFIPAMPAERGNPVFSVYQTDVFCLGLDLEHWLEVEFEGAAPPPRGSEKEIPFWSQAIRENEARLSKR
jgi:hypothetical protein